MSLLRTPLFGDLYFMRLTPGVDTSCSTGHAPRSPRILRSARTFPSQVLKKAVASLPSGEGLELSRWRQGVNIAVLKDLSRSSSVAPILFPFFFGGCNPLKMVFPKKGFPFFPGSLNN